MVTLREYYKMLDKHDWFFDMSDDHSVWSKGWLNDKLIHTTSTHSDEHKKLYDAFYRYLSKVDAAKPPLPPMSSLEIAMKALKDIATIGEPTTYDDVVYMLDEIIEVAKDAINKINEREAI